MKLGTFIGRQKSVEKIKKVFGSTKRFDSQYAKLVEKVNLAMQEEKPKAVISKLPESTDFCSPKVLKAYGEFHALLKNSLDSSIS